MIMADKNFKIQIILGSVATAIAFLVCLFINKICALIVLLLGFFCICVFAFFTKKRYDSIEKLNDNLSLICSGNYDIKISENSEGELSILSNNLYKVVNLLKVQNEQLENDKVCLADSLADISHQLKTPLTSMMVISDILDEKPTEENINKFNPIINKQLNKMHWLITNLLKMSKLEAGTVELCKASVNMSAFIDECLAPFLITLDLKNIEVKKNISDFDFLCVEQWTAEAVQNIIKNCIEHTDKGGNLTITAFEESIYYVLIIKDNGCGIPKDELIHIFERFYSCSHADKESLGIGLAFAKTVLNKQNADIEAESQRDVGTQFTIKFYKSII